MMAGALQRTRWSRRRWITTIAALLLAHLALLLYYGERSRRLPRAFRARTAVHLAIDPWSSKQLEEIATVGDPALFAVPSLHGFSAKAWLTFRPVDYHQSEPIEPPVYLALDVNRLGQTFLDSIPTSAIPVLIRAEISSQSGSVPLPVPPLPVRIASELRRKTAKRPLRKS